MTIQASGALPASAINTELGLATSTQISIGGATPRALAGVASGAIRLAAEARVSTFVPSLRLRPPVSVSAA